MFRKPLLWMAFSLLLICGATLSWNHFPDAFPILDIDIQADREVILIKAEAIAEKHGLEPVGGRMAATFSADLMGKYFVELGGGGVSRIDNFGARLEITRQRLDYALNAFDQGLIGIESLYDTRDDLIETETRYLSVLSEYRQNMAALKAMLGETKND